MNFKECYKKANDEITGDRALLEKILNTPVKEKAKITPIFYKAASLAAAVLLVVTISLTPEIKDMLKKDVVTEKAVPEAVVSEKGATIEEYANEAAETDEVSVVSETAEINDTFTAEKSEVVKSNPVAEEALALDEPMVAMLSEEAEIEAYSGEEAASGGGSSAPVRMMSIGPKAADDIKTFTADEIFIYLTLGKETFAFEGMEMSFTEPIYARETNEGISGYEINIFLENENKKMMVLLSESVTPLELGIREESGRIFASKTVGDTDIYITAYNMTKEEVETYINSIA